MSGILVLFSSEIEHVAAFPDGDPVGMATGICGVGLVDAGIGAARLIASLDPSLVIFAGTCGAYPGNGLSIGELVIVSEVSLGSGDVANGSMRIPTLLPSRLTTDPDLCRRMLGSSMGRVHPRGVRCCCTLGITEEDGLAERLGSFDRSDVENLELFSILRAASSRPAAGLMGITNIVGSQGGAQWRENYRPMMKKVGDALGELLARGFEVLSPIDFPKESR